MASIPEFWDVGPHDPIPVESTWKRFVNSVNGKVVADILPTAPSFNNADFFFPDAKVVCELKEIKTEFLDTQTVLLRDWINFTKGSSPKTPNGAQNYLEVMSLTHFGLWKE